MKILTVLFCVNNEDNSCTGESPFHCQFSFGVVIALKISSKYKKKITHAASYLTWWRKGPSICQSHLWGSSSSKAKLYLQVGMQIIVVQFRYTA